jgi:predicted transcriptional regulator of viral defense system
MEKSMIHELRRSTFSEQFGYTFLIDQLQNYQNPRGKISRMLKSHEIIRVKKGLYVFGDQFRLGVINKGILANLIYGPSYVSGYYALSHYNMIPERVETVTSMTTQKIKSFVTPLGHFEYFHISQSRYSVGVEWQKANEEEYYLIASPEKALVDVIFKEIHLKKEDQLLEFLIDNMRIDEDRLRTLNLHHLTKINAHYKSSVISLLTKTLTRIV